MLVIDGARVDNLRYLSEHGINPEQVSTALCRIFNEMTFISGHLHCDPHLGNVFIRPRPNHSPNFEIVLLDHGLYRQIPSDLRVNYAHLWLSIISNDIPSMKYYSEIVANVPPQKFSLFVSAITGRDYGYIRREQVQVPRSIAEVERIKSGNVGGEIMLQLVDLLSNMPRIMLLLLKTNDLTRYDQAGGADVDHWTSHWGYSPQSGTFWL
jgi:aarF domain-containing kinase